MKIWAAVGCLLAILIAFPHPSRLPNDTAANVTDAYFDCRRSGSNCVKGYCQYETGDCNCPNGTEGYDCALESDTISTSCTVACLNNGTCIEISNGTYGCYCDEDYIGDTCERKRSEIMCDGENMTISVTPYTGFKGNIFIPSNEDDSTCDFTKKEEDGMVTYEAVLSLTEGCGAIVKNDTPSDGDTTYSRDVKIRYSPYFSSKFDQNIEVSCAFKAANVSDTQASIPDVGVDRPKIEKEKVESTYKPIRIDVQQVTGEKITSAINIGDHLRLYISLGDTIKYKKIKVESCVATNGLDGSKEKKVPLIDDSCPVSYEVITGPMQSKNSQTAIIVNFMAFKFTDSKKVLFECDVRHCVLNDNRCEPESCFGQQGTALGKRRKRDAASADDVVVRKSITVLDPSDTRILTENVIHPVDCMQRTEIITSIIIMSTAIIVLFVVCFFLALKVMRSRSRPKDSNNETDSTVSSDGTKLRIPRVRTVF